MLQYLGTADALDCPGRQSSMFNLDFLIWHVMVCSPSQVEVILAHSVPLLTSPQVKVSTISGGPYTWYLFV
jgi:hypothetical protein